MNIDLNSEDFNAKEGKAIFNNGNAGTVENVTISVKRKTAEDKDNAPDYKLTFTDETGASTDMGFYTVKGPVTYSNGTTVSVVDQVKKQGKVLKHVIHAIYGEGFAIPGATVETLLDVCMKVIRDGVASGSKFRVFANYGTNDSVKSFIQIRTWVPFMEPMSVAATDTRLFAGKIDNMIRVTKDAVGGGTSSAAASLTDDWD